MGPEEYRRLVDVTFEPDPMAFLSVPELKAIERDQNYPRETRQQAKRYRYQAENRLAVSE